MPAPTLDLAPVRAAIKAKILTVADIGQVHDYERWLNKQSALQELYASAAQTGTRLYGWFLSRFRTQERFIDTGRWEADVDWKMHAYMGVEDAAATEKKLDVQIELIRDAFRDDDTLGGAVSTMIIDSRGYQAGVQVDEIGHVTYAGVLCHRARLSVCTRIYF